MRCLLVAVCFCCLHQNAFAQGGERMDLNALESQHKSMLQEMVVGQEVNKGMPPANSQGMMKGDKEQGKVFTISDGQPSRGSEATNTNNNVGGVVTGNDQISGLDMKKSNMEREASLLNTSDQYSKIMKQYGNLQSDAKFYEELEARRKREEEEWLMYSQKQLENAKKQSEEQEKQKGTIGGQWILPEEAEKMTGSGENQEEEGNEE